MKGGPISRDTDRERDRFEHRNQDFHLFTQQVFTESLLSAVHCAKS